MEAPQLSMLPTTRSAATELAAVRLRKAALGKSGAGPKGLRHKWLRLDTEGETLVLTAGKSHLTAKLGVQARDLRLLDAAPASSPPAILARDKAIVVNLEFLKCIITTDYALILDSGEQRMLAFVEELRRRLRGTDGSSNNSMFGDFFKEHDKRELLEKAFEPSEVGSDLGSRPGSFTAGGSGSRQGSPRFAPRIAGRLELTDILEEMPFEMRVLEAALDFVTAYMEHLTSDLDRAAHPTLDAVISKVTEKRLDRLRTIKSRIVRLDTRVQTIRELLEKLLDDDDDMRDMNLAARVRQEERVQTARRLSVAAADPTTPGGSFAPPEPFDREEEEERDKDQDRRGASPAPAATGSHCARKVEQLLETYFMNLDNTWNRLQTLAEYVDDTEDYIRFDIDTKRNQFIEYRLLVIICTFGITVPSTLYNILGQNLAVNAAWKTKYSVFLATVFVSLSGATVMVLAILWWARRKHLLLYNLYS